MAGDAAIEAAARACQGRLMATDWLVEKIRGTGSPGKQACADLVGGLVEDILSAYLAAQPKTKSAEEMLKGLPNE